MKKQRIINPLKTHYFVYFIVMRNEYKPFFIVNRLFYRAMHIVVICVMLVGALPLSAQVYSTAKGGRYDASYPTEYGAAQQNAYSAHEAQVNYNSYQSTVYQPFESSVPSMISGKRNSGESTGGSENSPNGSTNYGDDWIHPSDPEDNSNESPVGEAWVMLLFAAVAALVVFVRQRKVQQSC